MNQLAVTKSTRLTNAQLVLDNGEAQGDLCFSEGIITHINEEGSVHEEIDLQGDYLIPGLVDIHTDHFEKHVYPRPHVKWDMLRAAMANDAQIIGGGVTTVFDSICVGATRDNPARREILAPMVEAMEKGQAAGMFKSEHLIHLRCEVTDTYTTELTREHIGKDIVQVVSVMEHIPGIRQSRDIDHFIERNVVRGNRSREEIMASLEEDMVRMQDIGKQVRPHIVQMAHDHDLPLLSHDDTEPEHIDLAVSEKVAISEFPCTLEAARLAHQNGMKIVAGAPNILRGGSQSGNVAVKDLMAENLVDILASDYVPRSMLDASFLMGLSDDFDVSLSDAIRMVSLAPAQAANLHDRGEIAVGKRADLVQVALHDGYPYVKRIWRQGERVV